MEEELHEKLLNLVKVQQGEIKNNTIYKKKNTKKYLKGTNKNKQTKKHMQNR